MALQALSIALDYPDLSTDPRILCRAATVCQSWRQAVQQCCACNADVSLENVTLQQLASLTAWLPKHASLVRSTTIGGNLQNDVDGVVKMGALEYSHLVVQLLQPALQLAALLPPAAATAAAGGAPIHTHGPAAGSLSQQQQQQRHGLRLASFSCSAPGGEGLLACLPPHSLTELVFGAAPSPGATTTSSVIISAVASPSLAAALARLSSLQRLHLQDAYGSMPACSLPAVAQLSKLTYLRLSGKWRGVARPLHRLQQQQLPPLQQPPPLRELHLGLKEQLPAMDLSKLSWLEDLTVSNGLETGSVLPSALQRLQLESVHNSDHMSVVSSSSPWRLQQLRRVTLGVGFHDRAALLQLTQLPALQHLMLEYPDTEAAAHTAPVWRQLPQLQELHLLLESLTPLEAEMAAILAGVSGATSLTKLMLRAVALSGDDGADAELCEVPVAPCASLTSLSRLQDLCFEIESKLAPGDVMALTALTGLTKLNLCCMRDAVGDVAATALACNLKQLHHLDLTECGLGDMVCLAAIHNLTQLTALRLEGNEGITQQGLMLLTGLSSLQQLCVDENKEVTAAVMDEFWAAVRQGKQQQQQQQ